jgi:hypothetical protein
MTQETVLDTLGQRLSKFAALDAEGTGGILLAWDDEVVSDSDLQCKVFMVTAMVTMVLTNMSFLLTTCYGPADDRRKEEFLQEMTSIKPASQIPWLIMVSTSSTKQVIKTTSISTVD